MPYKPREGELGRIIREASVHPAQRGYPTDEPPPSPGNDIVSVLARTAKASQEWLEKIHEEEKLRAEGKLPAEKKPCEEAYPKIP